MDDSHFSIANDKLLSLPALKHNLYECVWGQFTDPSFVSYVRLHNKQVINNVVLEFREFSFFSNTIVATLL